MTHFKLRSKFQVDAYTVQPIHEAFQRKFKMATAVMLNFTESTMCVRNDVE